MTNATLTPAENNGRKSRVLCRLCEEYLEGCLML